MHVVLKNMPKKIKKEPTHPKKNLPDDRLIAIRSHQTRSLKLTGLMGFEPTTFSYLMSTRSVEGCRSIQAELQAHACFGLLNVYKHLDKRSHHKEVAFYTPQTLFHTRGGTQAAKGNACRAFIRGFESLPPLHQYTTAFTCLFVTLKIAVGPANNKPIKPPVLTQNYAPTPH